MRHVRLSVLLCFAVLFTAGILKAETIQCPATKDTWVSSSDKETDSNMGKAPKIKLKGYQEFGLLDFDVSALKGKKVVSAKLCVAPVGEPAYGKERGSELRWFTVSTVSSDWKEGDGTNYTIDYDGEGATFNESSFSKQAWSYPGSKLWDVSLGNGNTIRTDVDGGNPKDGWFEIPVDNRIVAALVAKTSYGIVLMDGSVFTASNPFISSHEGAKPPFLKVDVEAAPAPAVKAPADAAAVAAPNDAAIDSGALTLTLTVPENAFAYNIAIDGKPAPRWQIPFATAAGSKQSFPLQYLTPNADVKIDLTAVDAAGNTSEATHLTAKTSPIITVPKLPESGWLPQGGKVPKIGEKLQVWAFPEICKLDPLTGEIVQEKQMEKAHARNSVWDAATQTIRVPAARGEIAAFQLALVSPNGQPVTAALKIEGLDGIKTNATRTWFVNVKDQWQADYCIPLKADAGIFIPAPDNRIPNQRAAAVNVDMIIPFNATSGEKTGTVTVSIGDGEVKLKLQLVVYDAVIPAETNMIPELNVYGGPFGNAGTDIFFDAFRIAHYYRCTINRVPHHHNGSTDADWIPKTGPDGHVADWTEYDKNLGPLLDGSAFKDNPRANVPVPLLYLPFNESYPLPIKEHYKPGANVPLVGKDWKELHDMLALPPEQAFDQGYKDAFVNCVADFMKHYEEKGWTHTIAEGFNNNKYHYGKVKIDVNGKQELVPGMTGTAWTLDEPQQWLDWQALLFYAKLFHKGIEGQKNTKFAFRSDVSRPMWQGNCMDGYMDVMVAGGVQFSMLPLMKNLVRRTGMKLFDYGGCNSQDRANHNTTAWVLKSYAHGCDGVLPWQSIGGEVALEKGDFTGPKGGADDGNMLIINTTRFGGTVVASARLQAFRSGCQICELLRLLEQKKGWSRDHSAALVSQLIPLGAQFKEAFADDAAALKFDDANGDVFVQLKEGILKLLSEK